MFVNEDEKGTHEDKVNGTGMITVFASSATDPDSRAAGCFEALSQ